MKTLSKIFLLGCFLFSSCTEQEPNKEPDVPLSFLEKISVCDPVERVNSVKEVRGLVLYDEWLEDYIIKRGIDGTYDTVYIGFICDLPLEYQNHGTKIIFSGTYFKIEEEKAEMIPVRMVGEEYFILKLDQIKVRKST